MRFTSGTGSEVQMGQAETNPSQARCLYVTKAAGVQERRMKFRDCIGIPATVPSGIRGGRCWRLPACWTWNVLHQMTKPLLTRTYVALFGLLMRFAPGTDFINSEATLLHETMIYVCRQLGCGKTLTTMSCNADLRVDGRPGVKRKFWRRFGTGSTRYASSFQRQVCRRLPTKSQ